MGDLPHGPTWERYFPARRDNDNIRIYIHAKRPEEVSEPWRQHVIASAPTSWGFLTRGYEALFAAAYDDGCTFAVLLSDSCVPIRPFHDLRAAVVGEDLAAAAAWASPRFDGWCARQRLGAFEREQRVGSLLGDRSRRGGKGGGGEGGKRGSGGGHNVMEDRREGRWEEGRAERMNQLDHFERMEIMKHSGWFALRRRAIGRLLEALRVLPLIHNMLCGDEHILSLLVAPPPTPVDDRRGGGRGGRGGRGEHEGRGKGRGGGKGGDGSGGGGSGGGGGGVGIFGSAQPYEGAEKKEGGGQMEQEVTLHYDHAFTYVDWDSVKRRHDIVVDRYWTMFDQHVRYDPPEVKDRIVDLDRRSRRGPTPQRRRLRKEAEALMKTHARFDHVPDVKEALKELEVQKKEGTKHPNSFRGPLTPDEVCAIWDSRCFFLRKVVGADSDFSTHFPSSCEADGALVGDAGDAGDAGDGGAGSAAAGGGGEAENGDGGWRRELAGSDAAAAAATDSSVGL
jgi:hypothetical protein